MDIVLAATETKDGNPEACSGEVEQSDTVGRLRCMGGLVETSEAKASNCDTLSSAVEEPDDCNGLLAMVPTALRCAA